MVAIFSRLAAFTHRHPIVRGMISYGTLWPTSCLIQQTMAGKRIDTYDWMEVLRFSLYGGLFTAPTLYTWIKMSTKIWPGTSFTTCISKAVLEQFTYAPVALVCFFFGMSLLEGKSIHECKQAVEQKFLPSWKVSVCIWPIISTVNYRYIPQKNRVPFLGACSLIWCCFMAYMQQLDLTDGRELKLTERLLTNTQ